MTLAKDLLSTEILGVWREESNRDSIKGWACALYEGGQGMIPQLHFWAELGVAPTLLSLPLHVTQYSSKKLKRKAATAMLFFLVAVVPTSSTPFMLAC